MTNYQKQMENVITNLAGKPHLLLHACCAPCSISALEKLDKYFDVTLYFYNPNIDSIEEFDLRLAQFDKLKCVFEFKLVAQKYEHSEFLDKLSNLADECEGGARCKGCIALRLAKTFQYAKDNGFDYVATTLTSSPMKDAEFINQTGLKLAQEFKINYLVSDFKKKDGYLHSLRLCEKLNIYRQHYCGCEFGKAQQNLDEKF